MQSGYYSATGGMVAQMNRLDVIANNLANSNTAGFKRDDVVFGDYLRLSREYRDELPKENHTREGAKFLNRSLNKTPHVIEEYTQFELGSLMKSGNDLDVSLNQKDLFFAVDTQNGLRLTKNGSFNLDAQGRLVTKDGNPVMSSDYMNTKEPIIIPTGSKVDIDKNGVVSVNNKPIASLMIAQIPNTKFLEKEGNTNFIPRNVSDIKFVGNSNSVLQGFVEKSNINPISEMTALIETQRMVDMYSKVMQTHMNDLNTEAINKLANAKG
jgi:flagellar basal-body rod protein FlgG